MEQDPILVPQWLKKGSDNNKYYSNLANKYQQDEYSNLSNKQDNRRLYIFEDNRKLLSAKQQTEKYKKAQFTQIPEHTKILDKKDNSYSIVSTQARFHNLRGQSSPLKNSFVRNDLNSQKQEKAKSWNSPEQNQNRQYSRNRNEPKSSTQEYSRQQNKNPQVKQDTSNGNVIQRQNDKKLLGSSRITIDQSLWQERNKLQQLNSRCSLTETGNNNLPKTSDKDFPQLQKDSNGNKTQQHKIQKASLLSQNESGKLLNYRQSLGKYQQQIEQPQLLYQNIPDDYVILPPKDILFQTKDQNSRMLEQNKQTGQLPFKYKFNQQPATSYTGQRKVGDAQGITNKSTLQKDSNVNLGSQQSNLLTLNLYKQGSNNTKDDTPKVLQGSNNTQTAQESNQTHAHYSEEQNIKKDCNIQQGQGKFKRQQSLQNNSSANQEAKSKSPMFSNEQQRLQGRVDFFQNLKKKEIEKQQQHEKLLQDQLIEQPQEFRNQSKIEQNGNQNIQKLDQYIANDTQKLQESKQQIDLMNDLVQPTQKEYNILQQLEDTQLSQVFLDNGVVAQKNANEIQNQVLDNYSQSQLNSEEEAFLKQLGWNSDDVEQEAALSEDEIKAFQLQFANNRILDKDNLDCNSQLNLNLSSKPISDISQKDLLVYKASDLIINKANKPNQIIISNIDQIAD